MAKTITIEIDDKVQETLEDLARARGVSIERVIAQAIAEHLFLTQQRLLGNRVVIQEKAGGFREVLTPYEEADRSLANKRMNDLIRGALGR